MGATNNIELSSANSVACVQPRVNRVTHLARQLANKWTHVFANVISLTSRSLT